MIQEIWRDVEGYEGYYKVSNFGRVKNLERKVKGHPGINTIKEKILKSQKQHGYRSVTFSVKNSPKLFLIHRLVAKAFLPNPENKTQINHKDFDRSNNHVDNLEWATRIENVEHAYIRGHYTIGEKNGMSVLTDAQVIQIKKILNKIEYNPKLKHKLADRFGVKERTIRDIVFGRHWKNIQI